MYALMARTILLYLLIVAGLRIMGKRQIGELQPSELVVTILISNIATLPIQDLDVPLSGGIVPILTIVCFEVFAEPLVAVFNSEHDPVMADLACQGMRLYFLGYLFAGFNIAGTGYLSAVGAAKWAMITSILRGVAAIVLCALVMAALFGMTGVWLAFCAAEAITAGVMAVAMKKTAIV